jgi:hypothetical protein
MMPAAASHSGALDAGDGEAAHETEPDPLPLHVSPLQEPLPKPLIFTLSTPFRASTHCSTSLALM